MCLLDIYKVAPVVVAMCLPPHPPPPPWCRDITQAIAISSPDTRIVEDAVGETCTSDDECLPLAWRRAECSRGGRESYFGLLMASFFSACAYGRVYVCECMRVATV